MIVCSICCLLFGESSTTVLFDHTVSYWLSFVVVVVIIVAVVYNYAQVSP